MLVLLSAGIIAAAIGWAGFTVARALAVNREERAKERTIQMLALFAPGIAAAAGDSRELLTWQPLAATARRILPAEFEALDRATGSHFPFSAEQIDAAHARWSADWLTWELAHDAEYKMKAAQAEAEGAAGSPLGLARLDAVEREKLELYQRRYTEYVRVSKALQALRP